MAAVTFARLVIAAGDGLIATWADLGGRWFADRRRVWVDDDRLWLADEDTDDAADAGSRIPFSIRRSERHVFLVEERHLAAFDASADPARGEWIDRDDPGAERGYRAFLQVDLGAFWTRALAELQHIATRERVLQKLARGTLLVEHPAEGDEERLEARGLLLEGFDHVDPAALLDAVLRAGEGLVGPAATCWWTVLDGVPADAIPASVDAALVARLRAARGDDD